MGFSDLFKSRKDTTTLEPMLTDEQKKAMGLLLGFSQTGTTPTGYKAGEAADLSGFDFGLSSTEGIGQSLLQRMLSGGEASGITTARNRLTDLANTEFNPDDPSSGFAAYKRQVARATGDANDVLNREAAITGNRFGNRIAGEKAELAAVQSDLLSTKLAQLFDSAQNRQLQASQSLGNLETQNEGINQNRLASAFGYGGIERDLKNQKANLFYEDRQRQRDEQLNTLTGAETVFNRNIDYGLKSITTKKPSVLMGMLGEISPLAGSYNTHKYGYTTNQTSISDGVKVLMQMLAPGAGGGE